MELTRTLHLTYLTISPLFFLQVHCAATTSAQFIDTLSSFIDPELSWFYKVIVDLDGNVYVTGQNVLHYLSSDLELKESVNIGPMMHHPDCLHPSYPCSTRKELMDNHILILQLVYNLESRPSLLLCGSIYRMLCQIRPVDRLTDFQWVHPLNETVGYTSSEGNTESYFGPGFDDNQTLITAGSIQNDFKDNHFTPFLTSKVVEKDGKGYKIRYSFENETARSAMEFSTWTERYVLDGGVAHDGFVYFLILYAPESMINEMRLIRVCTQDGTFQSYSELPIACDHPTGRFNNDGYALNLDDSPSSVGKSLYVMFSRNTGDHPGSGLCIFPMTDVIRAFTTFPRNCLSAVGHSCQKEMKTDITDFCGSDVNPYTVSQPLVVPCLTFFPRKTISTITTVRHGNEMVAIVGDQSGVIFKIALTSGHIISKNNIFNMNSTASIRGPTAFDLDRQNVYLLKGGEIVKFPVASCRVHETCESCFTEGKNDPLNCGWCGGYCAHSKECEDPGSFSRDTCTPRIFQVSSQKGPIQGGIKIKITGDSLGTYVDEVHNLITVAGIPCEVFNWKNKEITCILGPAPEGTTGPVELNVTNLNSTSISYNVVGSASSHLNFSYYLGPRLFGIYPNKGPTSGGTNVSLFGENLDFENSKDRYFIVGGKRCKLREYNITTGRCVTVNEIIEDYPDKIAIVVGNVTYMMEETLLPTLNNTEVSQSFEYIPDPEILQIQPGLTTVSGLMNLTVTGHYLDSVLSPKLVVNVSLSKSTSFEFIEECWSDPESSGTKLTCSTPSLVNQLWLPVPTRTSPLTTHVSFIMDGVKRVREFSRYQEPMSRLLYYPDPEFKSFGGIEEIEDDQTSMQIKGNNLGLLHSVNNFHIKLGANDSCEITSVTTELLVCDLPLDIQNSSSTPANISVEVFMDSTRYHLGYITIVPVKPKQVVLEKFLLAVFIGSPFAVLVIVFICFRKIRERKRLRDMPPLPSRFYVTDDLTEESSDEMIILDSERMFILEELGLIIKKEHLTIGELIGSGQFGKVFKGSLQIPDQKEIEIAIKTLYQHLWRNPIKADLFMKEALTMKDFDHPHVLGLLGVCFEGSVPHIVLPFMENGDLLNYIRDNTKTLLVSDLLKFAVDIATGMCYLAKLKFVHRDLAARNCVLDSSMRVKVADFGLSRDIYEGNYYRSQDKHAELPFRWTAPEVIELQVSTSQSDVWSYGVLLWELMTRGCIPYSHIGNWDVLPYLKIGNRLNQPQLCPKPLYLSMLACWNTDPKKRPTFYKLHSYISEIHSKLLNDMVTEASPSSDAVEGNALYVQFTVPAQNTNYFDSKELYLKMDGHVLNVKDLEGYVVMKDLEEAFLIMINENVTVQTRC